MGVTYHHHNGLSRKGVIPHQTDAHARAGAVHMREKHPRESRIVAHPRHAPITTRCDSSIGPIGDV